MKERVSLACATLLAAGALVLLPEHNVGRGGRPSGAGEPFPSISRTQARADAEVLEPGEGFDLVPPVSFVKGLLEPHGQDHYGDEQQSGRHQVGPQEGPSRRGWVSDEQAPQGRTGDSSEGVHDRQPGESPALVAPVGDLAQDGGHDGGIPVEEAHGNVDDQDVPVGVTEAEEGEADAEEGGADEHDWLPPDAIGKVAPEEVCHELGQGEGGGKQANIQAGLALWYLGEGGDHGGQVWADGVEGGLLGQAQQGQEEELPDGEGCGVPVGVAAVGMPVASPPARSLLLGGRVGVAGVGGIAWGLWRLGGESVVLVGGMPSHLAEMAQEGSSAPGGLGIAAGVVGPGEGGHRGAGVERAGRSQPDGAGRGWARRG